MLRPFIKKLIAVLSSAALLCSIAACGNRDKPDQAHPVTLTVWHNYVEQMRDSFDDLMREFNDTVGAENGITVKVTSIANTSVIGEKIIAAANDDPGAPEMPDMAVLYPKVAFTLAEKGALVDLGRQFSQAELDAFVPLFLEEGKLGGDTLYLLPIAKSTEVLYLNRTLFDRFAAATGVTEASLATFEGIAEVSVKYYEWTDAKTPDIPCDGKMFYYPEGLFNYSMIGFQQLGGDIVREKRLDLTDPVFARIWDCYFRPAVKGGAAIFSEYGNYLAATGDIVCCTSSSAGSSFYPGRVTYTDNTKEYVVFDVLPYPVFEGGEPVVFQRGGGICVTKSEPAREYAAALFLKWFTAPERNLRFTEDTGYMPVQQEALGGILAGNLPEIENPVVKKALIASANMQKDYRFYFPPVFEGFDALQTEYEKRLTQSARTQRDEYVVTVKQIGPQGADAAFEQASRDAMRDFIDWHKP